MTQAYRQTFLLTLAYKPLLPSGNMPTKLPCRINYSAPHAASNVLSPVTWMVKASIEDFTPSSTVRVYRARMHYALCLSAGIMNLSSAPGKSSKLEVSSGPLTCGSICSRHDTTASTWSRRNRLDGRGHAAKPFEVQTLQRNFLLLSEGLEWTGALGSSSKEGMHSYLIR